MTSIKFTGTTSVTAATTSFTVSLGGTPATGDLVLVFIGTDNEIVVHQPNYSGVCSWYQEVSLRAPDSSTLRVFSHMWNANDSGGTVTFTVSPAPSLGVGDKNISSVNVVALAATVDGGSSTGAVSLAGTQGVGDVLTNTVSSAPVHTTANKGIYVAYTNNSTGAWSASDPGATFFNLATNASGVGQTLWMWGINSLTPGYSSSFTFTGVPGKPMEAHVGISDTTTGQLYVPPFIEEGPVTEDRLGFRYKMNRNYTVLNNSGTYTAQRYVSTDTINSATAVYTNVTPVTQAQRNSINNSGVGGGFRATA